MSVLSASQLRVDFGVRGAQKLRAVDDVSFDLVPGKTVALVGESGSGKSTVVRVLARLLDPTSGQLLLDGEPIRRGHRALRAYRRRVQVIFQDPFASLNPAHTVAHHLRRPLLVNGRVRRSQVDEAVEELLRSVNLLPPAELATRYPHELSGGQRQRVAIARSLAPAPEVLLADEPVSMLDVSIRLEILNLLDELKRVRNLALLYVTHDLATARHFSSEILVMYRGEIVERGSSDEVILDPKHPYTQLLASAAPTPGATRLELAAARRARLAGRDARVAERHETTVDDGCRFRARCPFAMDVCRTRPADLETSAGHRARCWLYSPGLRNGQRSRSAEASAQASDATR